MGEKQRRDYGTGSISQRKDGTWTARMVIGVNEKGKPRIKALYGKTEREVKKKLKEFQKEFYKNDQTVVQKNTVESYMLNWLHTNKKNTLKPKSYDRLEQTITYQVIPHIGHIQLAAIQANDVQNMINKLAEEGKSYSTIKKAYDAVNECFRTGIIQKTVLFNPALGVTIPAKSSFGKKEIRCYDEAETKRLCETAVSVYSNGNRVYRLGDAIVLDVNTGLRLAEILALKWEEVDLKGRTIHINATRVIVKDRNEDASKKYVVIEQDSTKSQSSTRDIPLNDDAYRPSRNLRCCRRCRLHPCRAPRRLQRG